MVCEEENAGTTHGILSRIVVLLAVALHELVAVAEGNAPIDKEADALGVDESGEVAETEGDMQRMLLVDIS